MLERPWKNKFENLEIWPIRETSSLSPMELQAIQYFAEATEEYTRIASALARLNPNEKEFARLLRRRMQELREAYHLHP